MWLPFTIAFLVFTTLIVNVKWSFAITLLCLTCRSVVPAVYTSVFIVQINAIESWLSSISLKYVLLSTVFFASELHSDISTAQRLTSRTLSFFISSPIRYSHTLCSGTVWFSASLGTVGFASSCNEHFLAWVPFFNSLLTYRPSLSLSLSTVLVLLYPFRILHLEKLTPHQLLFLMLATTASLAVFRS